MKLLFLGKKNEPGCERAHQFCRENIDGLLSFLGARNEPLPEGALQWRGDYIISYLSPWIVPEHLLRAARMAAINFHPGPPEYPGTGCTNFALYEGASEYGVTCHHMEVKVDTGRIISVRRFPIEPTDTVWSVTQRCYAEILGLFHETMALVLHGATLPESSERWKRRPFTRRELDELCEVTTAMPEAEIARRIRATEFPGMPGAFLSVGGKQYPLSTPIRIDIVVPVRNEEEMIPIFIRRIFALRIPPVVELSILFVEDGSTDDTRAVLAKSVREFENVACIFLQKGKGQGPAVVYGLARSNSDAVIMMDADCGHSPNVVPEMIESFLKGHEVVQATRIDADDQVTARSIAGTLFNLAARILTGVDLTAQNVYFRLVSRELKETLVRDAGFAHFLRIPALSKRKVAYARYDRESRQIGESKYGFLRLLKFSLVGLIALTSPKRLIGVGAGALIVSAILWSSGFWITGGAILAGMIVWSVSCYWIWNQKVLDQLKPV